MFSKLNLHSDILKAIDEIGYKNPTPIQTEVIPKILDGSDIRASAPTGTGKTAAFILPALNRLMIPSKSKGHGPRVLILVPTRELAVQIMTQAKKYSRNLNFIKTICIYGGVPYFEQNRDLKSRHDILVATPGRLLDHMERGKIDFSRLELFILDEADRMLDMGFIDPVKQIANSIGPNRQTLMFSATLQGAVLKLSENLLKNPVEVKIVLKVEENKNIEQKLFYVNNIQQKYQLLFKSLNDPEFQQVLVFTSTKRLADELAVKLKEQDFQAAALHGDMRQGKRNKTIMQMRKGKIRILVATDVAARGIDVRTITHVINFDLPQIAEDYVHRIGRTGRAGAKGIALSFVSSRDFKMLKEIEKFTGHKFEKSNEFASMDKKNDSPKNFKKDKRRFKNNNRHINNSNRYRNNSNRHINNNNRHMGSDLTDDNKQVLQKTDQTEISKEKKFDNKNHKNNFFKSSNKKNNFKDRYKKNNRNKNRDNNKNTKFSKSPSY